MNKKEHILNGLLLGVGTGIIMAVFGSHDWMIVPAIIPPVLLGVLFPDADTEFGKHRKTLHNIWVLIGFFVFPIVFGNLHYVWIGVLSHYALDMIGSRRGLALFHPVRGELSLPFGVRCGSTKAMLVTTIVTAMELATVYAYVFYGIPV